MEKVRRPAVAGSFYPGTEEILRMQIEKCFLDKLGPGKLPEVNADGEGKIIGLVSPHAGYVYSGPVATHGFYSLARQGIPDVVIILGPNHQGMGSAVSLSIADEWQTPLGTVKVNREIGKDIQSRAKIIDKDESAHQFEHSLEVQIPFLQYLYGNKFEIVCLCLLDQSLETSRKLGEAIAPVLKEKKAIVLASTDFTHYEPANVAKEKDRKAIERILKIDPEGLGNTVQKENISMCGPGPVMALLAAAEVLGIKEAHLLKYANSGHLIGDYQAVVGYASLNLKR